MSDLPAAPSCHPPFDTRPDSAPLTMAFLREAPWLTGARLRRWGRPFLLALFGGVAAAAFLVVLAAKGGKPGAIDFHAFWVAGRFVLEGHPVLAYDDVAMEGAERAASRMAPGYIGFYYPPPFLLLCAPLGLLGFFPALLVFLAAEMALVLAALRRLVPRHWGWLPLLAFPGFLMNALSGQNAALSAACFGGAAVWLDRRPALAGLCLGGLVYKPQLALCIPLALIVARRYRTLSTCGAAALAVCAVSWAALGVEPWRHFLAHLAEARGNIVAIAGVWPKLQSVFGLVRLHHGNVGVAATVQVAFSLLAALWLAFVNVRRRGALMEVAALTTASLAFTPYLLDYDLAILAVPMACLAGLAHRRGWRPYEKIVLLALFLLPLAARASGMLLGLTLGPPFMLMLMALLWRRAHEPFTVSV